MNPQRPYTVADFDFTLPPGLIAQHPAAQRSASRLLDGTGALPVDRVFHELPGLLNPGDLLVFNDTRVIQARLHGEKATGGAVEALVERVLPNNEVWAHIRASKSPKPGTLLSFARGAFEADPPSPTVQSTKSPPRSGCSSERTSTGRTGTCT